MDLRVTCPLLLDFSKTWNVSTNFIEIPQNSDFIDIRQAVLESLYADRRTDTCMATLDAFFQVRRERAQKVRIKFGNLGNI